MLTLYFSGTGNSRFVAELFSQKMDAPCHSIEEAVDFTELIALSGTIAFVYPIYGSYVPRIMREFVSGIKDLLENKKIIIFCTQYLFSGDGTRAFAELLPNRRAVIYTEHFLMPNNICNFPPFSTNNELKIRKYITKTERKMDAVCNNIKTEVVKKRGFGVVSKILGSIQRPAFRYGEPKISKDARVKASCSRCGICVSICPMRNLKIEDNSVKHNKNCTLCYRCVNRCPKKAITVFTHGRIKTQYNGVKY